MPSRISFSDDPITLALRPPPNETPAERDNRIKDELEAKRVSDEIDKELDRERAELRRRTSEIRVLLLGPSCAGKSTTLKNFQLSFTPKALQAEAATYAALVFLNIVTSVRLVRDVIEEHRSEPGAVPLPDGLYECAERLRAVVDLERSLMRRFGASLSQSRAYATGESAQPQPYEPSLRTGGLKKMLQSSRKSEALSPSRIDEESERSRLLLVEHRAAIETLVQHPDVRELMASRSLRLEHLPGFFLNDLERITAPDYTPSDDDILRTRIRTLGVSEMHFTLESGQGKGQTWVIIDVGGARHQRAAWVPYFDDVSTVIFMAPIGQFDQFLEEDSTINYIQDTLELWGSIVSQKLLANTQFILFLNKYDMLKKKLESGIQFSDFVPSYTGDNDAQSVGRFLSKKFSAIHKSHSPVPRNLHSHFTSVTDKSTTVALLTHFRVVWLQNHLRHTTLL